jgi:2-amino-4-hydroxy-6-hydroxymethyldihydropteridine diphosphokinase
LVHLSRFYRTSPVDYTDQAWFINTVAEIATILDPLTLLDELLAIQQRMGRKADAIRFGPRIIDLDILLYNEVVMKTTRLEIPHPRMHKRAFVLQPICDINPDVIHPVIGKTVSDLLDGLGDEEQQIVLLEKQLAGLEGRAS